MNDGLANSGAALSRSTQSNAWVPLAQWFAVLTMTLEHVTKYVWPESAFVPWALAIGRIAFPVFAGMVAWHLLHNTRRPVWYGLRLLLIGAISQVPYAWVVTPDRLNICFTLAFGLLAVVLLDQVKDRRTRMATGVVLFLLAAVVSPFVEYQILGLLLVPAFVYAFRNHQRVAAMLPALALCAVINGGSPLHMAISCAAGCAVLLAPSLSFEGAAVPALPRGLRLSWYPLHLVAITVAIMAINQGAI